MNTVASFSNPLEANLAKSRLESAGIRAHLRNEQVHGLLPVSVLEIQLCVHPADMASARDLLESVNHGPEVPEESFREIGEREIRYFQRRRRWSRYRWLLWVLIALLAVLLIFFGW